MSAYHYIFIQPLESIDSLLADISAACETELRPVESEFIDYAGRLEHSGIDFETSHEYEEDYGIPFERYDCLLSVRDFDRDRGRQEEVARQIFVKLAALGKYALALVFDLQVLLDTAEPAPDGRRREEP